MDGITEPNQDAVTKKSPFDDLSREELVNKCKGLLVIAQKAKQAKNELQVEIESYKQKINKYEDAKKISDANLQTLQELVDSLTEQKLDFITESDQTQSHLRDLRNKCDDYEEEIKKFKADLIIRDTNISELTQKLSTLDCELISFKRQNNRLLDENEQLINQLTEIEAKTAEVNDIGLKQQQQLKFLEENVIKDENNQKMIEDLQSKVKELENELQKENNVDINALQIKIQEITCLYENEKSKKERVNIKLKSYKDKILKCAACINQLKNSRFILAKTVKDYSENIPKWQNDIIKASKELDLQLNQLNTENFSLKDKVQHLEEQLKAATHTSENSQSTEFVAQNEMLKSECEKLKQEFTKIVTDNSDIRKELVDLKQTHQNLTDFELTTLVNKNQELIHENDLLKQKFADLMEQNSELEKYVHSMKEENLSLSKSLGKQSQQDLENLLLQIKGLESEKATLVKEKLNARDTVVDFENKNKALTDQMSNLSSQCQMYKSKLETVSQEKVDVVKRLTQEKEGETNLLKCDLMALQEQYDRLKKEYDDLQDLNTLLKEEVETLKLSLEQPIDDSDNLSDLNVSLQADIVKLETKLASYKQENSSLLIEVKESRNKIKEYDSLLTEYEDVKSKLLSYKTENTELLNEMKEINQVLKERGETISKLQKAIVEMERLIETLEKDKNESQQEKTELLKKIEVLETELNNIKVRSNETCEMSNILTVERDSALKSLEEKDLVITTLRDEIEKLKQQPPQIGDLLPNDDNMSTSTISRAEEHARMKDLDETFEERYTKLRLFALKLKKKLNETVSQLQSSEEDKTRLTKLLNDNNVDSKSTLNEDSQLQDKVKTLTIALQEAELKTSECEKLKDELETKNKQLNTEIEAHKVTKENLEKARRDAKKKNVLSLEMEDYERSMKDLTSKMEENKKKMVQMESTIDTQEGTITAMKTQIKLLEEQIKTEEKQNRLLKEELQHSIEESKEKDNVLQVKNEIITKLEQDLEDEKAKNEESNLETTALLSEKEKVIISLGEDKIELNNKVKRLEFKCAELNDAHRILSIELADLKTEYTSYKVRAQAVLRQNQTVDHSHEEQLKEEVTALKAQVEKLTTKLTVTQEQLELQVSETESVRRRAADAAGEAQRAQQRNARLHADLTRLGLQLDSDRTQHKLQVTTITQCYKTQISELEAKLQMETESLKKQLALARENAMVGNVAAAVESNAQYMLPVIPKDDGSDGELDINVSMLPREEGEGSESAPSPPPSKPYLTGGVSGRSPVPLERLLEEGVPDDETLDTASLSLTPEQEIADLKRRLQAQLQRVKHVTVLLSESERECARMSQLSELLKAELRRVRGDTHGAHNTQYMKNVTLKFLTLPSGDERIRLVPVLQKILTLTSEETQKIQAIAKGLDPNTKGWGSYLPWPGGK